MEGRNKKKDKTRHNENKRKQTQFRNFGYWKEIFINKSNIKIQNAPPLHEKQKPSLKTLSKTSQNNLMKQFEHKLQVGKTILTPPPPLPSPSTPSEASLCCLLGLTAKQHVDLLFDPVLVVRLVRLCVGAVPEAARKMTFSFKFLFGLGCPGHSIALMHDLQCARSMAINYSQMRHFPSWLLCFLRSEVKFHLLLQDIHHFLHSP